jgi:hypothetical protein
MIESPNQAGKTTRRKLRVKAFLWNTGVLLKNVLFIILGLKKHKVEDPQSQSDELPSVRVLRKIAYGSIKATFLCFILGLTLQYLIPGCHCNEAVGCVGCGIDSIIDTLTDGGFIGFAISIVMLPILLFISMLVRVGNKWKTK